MNDAVEDTDGFFERVKGMSGLERVPKWNSGEKLARGSAQIEESVVFCVDVCEDVEVVYRSYRFGVNFDFRAYDP
jgi:hypothetical protein